MLEAFSGADLAPTCFSLARHVWATIQIVPRTQGCLQGTRLSFRSSAVQIHSLAPPRQPRSPRAPA